MKPNEHQWPRRKVLACLGAIGATTPIFNRALVVMAQDAPAVTTEMIQQAEWIAGLKLDSDKREMMLSQLNQTLESYRKLRAIEIKNHELPAIHFHPHQHHLAEAGANTHDKFSIPKVEKNKPHDDFDVAFGTIAELAAWMRTGHVTAAQLAQLSLYRLQTYDAELACVISRTEDRALNAARNADRSLREGKDLGVLHGIPWGAKDLLAVKGYRTTWGATPTQDQVINETATVVERLDDAGCSLAAKLTLGALAWGDVWYGGMTKNPWNLEQGSSGSSAGSASAVAAGLVPFAIGSETWGSIVSPASRCGVTGLRPTFGRVSRHGAMALAWTMDKLGPLARSAEDCGYVFHAIHGADPKDPHAVDRKFDWKPKQSVQGLTLGFNPQHFEAGDESELDGETKRLAEESRRLNRATLDTLQSLGVKLVEWRAPEDVPVDALSFILSAEAATAFDAWTRDGRDDALVRQEIFAWPNFFRVGQTIPAVEYLRANRLRQRLMDQLETQLGDLDGWITPPFAGSDLLMTNLTGHPCVVFPNGFRHEGTPTSMTINGRLYGEAKILSIVEAYQSKTDFHRRRPPMALVKGKTS